MAIYFHAHDTREQYISAAEGNGEAAAMYARWTITGIGPDGHTIPDDSRDILAAWVYDCSRRAAYWAARVLDATR